jgi:hypothetical protein
MTKLSSSDAVALDSGNTSSKVVRITETIGSDSFGKAFNFEINNAEYGLTSSTMLYRSLNGMSTVDV